MSKENKKKILIIGGGYAGISAMHKLKNNDDFKLTLIDTSQKHLLQTHIHKYLSGHYNKDDITFNHKKYCEENNIEFICDEVTDINYEKNFLMTKEMKLINYDYVIVATGGISIFPKQIENIVEYTKDIKKIDNLDYYRNKFFKILKSNPKNKTIVVVGGGVSGIQIACEYAYTIQNKGLNKEDFKVVLVEGMNTILPGMDQFLIKEAQERCSQLNIEIITNLFASKILADKIILSNNKEIPYDMLLFVIGSIGNSISHQNSTIEENQRNQLIVDDYYNISNYKNAFAIGDIIQASDTKTNEPQAPTAQGARMQAELVVKNIIRRNDNKKLIKNNIWNKGILIDLGGPNFAVGRLFGFNLTGKIALLLKKLIYSLHSKKFN